MKTMQERWLNGEDVVIDPFLDEALERIDGILAKLPDEERAQYCCMSEHQRARYRLAALLALRDKIARDYERAANTEGA